MRKRVKMKKVVWIVLVLALMLAGCGKENKQEEFGAENTGMERESSTQDEESYILTFEAMNLEGETVTEACFADSKLTMINVWATYCNPCLMEMPDLGMIAASYDPEEFQLIGIISDVSEEAAEEDITYAKELVAQTGAAYPHLLLSESLFHNLVGAVEAVPTTFFVNQQGEVLGYAVGANSKEAWEEIIHEILAQME